KTRREEGGEWQDSDPGALIPFLRSGLLCVLCAFVVNSFMDDPQRYLDPVALAKVRSLELQARLIVEGYLSGMHKSPYHGFSVEFAQHREYVPGDDIKHVDWKVYGRTERFYLKQYEEETNLVCWLLLDVSESMQYRSKGISKYDYACMVAVSLAYLTLHQQ